MDFSFWSLKKQRSRFGWTLHLRAVGGGGALDSNIRLEMNDIHRIIYNLSISKSPITSIRKYLEWYLDRFVQIS